MSRMREYDPRSKLRLAQSPVERPCFGRLSDEERGNQCNRRRKGAWRFEGLTSLLPAYEQLEEPVLGRQEAETLVRRSGRSTMKKPTYSLLVAGLALALWPAEGRTQSAGPGERASADALVLEVRLLRQAIEHQTVIAARTQVLATRLGVQQERVGRAQDAVDGVADALDAATGRQGQLRETLVQLNSDLARVLHEPRRSELEGQVADVKVQLTSQDERDLAPDDAATAG